MCVAIVCPTGTTITDAQLWAGWNTNRDGGGYAYVHPNSNKVVIEKGFMSYNDFQRKLRQDVNQFSDTSPFLIHMRIRSAGSMHRDNTHPFRVRGGAMIHNGTLFEPPRGNKSTEGFSDTRLFAARLHNVLVYEDVRDTVAELEKNVSYNKLAFLYDNREFVIINERNGNWDNGVWFSNYSCRTSSMISSK